MVSEQERSLAYRLTADRKVEPCSLAEWSIEFEKQGGGTPVAVNDVGPVRVSTVFFGVVTNMSGPPDVFETMIFGGEHDRYQVKSATWEGAEAEHAKALAMVKESEGIPNGKTTEAR